MAELDANLRLSCVNSVSKIESNKGYVVRVLPFMVAGTQDKNNNAGNQSCPCLFVVDIGDSPIWFKWNS